MPITLRPADPASPDALWCLAQYYAELNRLFENGFDPGDAAYAGSLDAQVMCLLAYDDQIPAGCGQLVWKTEPVGEIKRMWIAPQARGQGLARRMLEALEDAARGQGLTAIRLDTNKALANAQQLYLAAGYSPIARYSDNPYAHHWFGKTL